MTGELALGGGNQPPLSGGSNYNGLSTQDSGFNSYNSSKGIRGSSPMYNSGSNTGINSGYGGNFQDSNQAKNSLRLLKSKMNNNTSSGSGNSHNYSPDPDMGYSSSSKPTFQSNQQQPSYNNTSKRRTDENSYSMGGTSGSNFEYSSGTSALPPRNRNVKESNDPFGSGTKPPMGVSKPSMTGNNNNNNQYSNNSYGSNERTTGARQSSLNARNNNNNNRNNFESHDEYGGSGSKGSKNRLSSNQHESKIAVSTGVQDIPVDPYPQQEIELVECPEGCGRQFNPDSLDKHVNACKKVFQTKRKEFNSQAHRMINGEQAKLVKQLNVKSQIEEKQAKPKETSKKPKWQQQSEAFRAIVKDNNGGGLNQSEKAAIQIAADIGMTLCDGCGRQFNQNAAIKHIPYCINKNQMNNIQSGPPKKGGAAPPPAPARNRGKY